MIRKIPFALTTFRLLLGPLLVALAFRGPQPALFFVLLLLGLLSDILDGIFARRLGVATEALRLYDTRADFVFWSCAAVASWIVYPAFLPAHRSAIAALFVAESSGYAVSFIRFRRQASVHAILSKVYGLALFVALAATLCFGMAGPPFYTAVALGIVSNAEVVLILLILPRWEHDIPSCYHALQLRKGRPIRKNRLFN